MQCLSTIKTWMDENLAWFTKETEVSKCNKGNFTFPTHIHYTNCNPPFQGYPPFLAKFLEHPQVTQFLEGRTPTPLITGGRGVGGGSNYVTSHPKDIMR